MLPLHHVKFDLTEGVVLEIESVKGKPGNKIDPPPSPLMMECTEETALDDIGTIAVPPICWRDQETLFEQMQLREETEYLVDITVPVPLDQAEARWRDNPVWPMLPRLAHYYRSNPPKWWSAVDGGVHVTGRLNFRAYVGATRLGLSEQVSVPLEIACTKIGYFDDFKALLAAVSEQIASLLLEVDSPTFSRFATAEPHGSELPVFLFLLRHVMRHRLPEAVEAILRSPGNRLESHTHAALPQDVQMPSPDLIAGSAADHSFHFGGPLSRLFSGYTPQTLPQSQTAETVNTPENRYVKSFLEDLLSRLTALGRRLRAYGRTASAREVTEWELQVGMWLSHRIWFDVGQMTHFPSNSQLLQRRQGYRELLQSDLALRSGLSLPWNGGFKPEEGIEGDLKPVSKLYEYWCFFVLRMSLRSICGPELVEGRSFLRVSEDGLSIELRRGKQSRVKFQYLSAAGRRAAVTLFYNRRFMRPAAVWNEWNNSYTASFDPDFSILIDVHTDAGTLKHWLHFDAKYRLDFAQWSAELLDVMANVEQENDDAVMPGGDTDEGDENARLYQQSDLYKMHTYRDALLGSRGSYLLFPGPYEDEKVFIRHPGHRYPVSPFSMPSVGAFQLRPSEPDRQKTHIEGFLANMLKQLTEANGYQEEDGLF